MTPGEVVALRIEKAVAGGRMLARHDGVVVLVAGGLPGEIVEARVERVQRGTVWAAVERVAEPSPHRVGEPNPCGGLVFAHASYDHQTTLRQQIVADTFRRVGRVTLEAPVPVAPSPAVGYRMRARLHVEGPQVGFYREGTHEVCDAASTGQLLEATSQVLADVARVLATRPGAVEAIDLAENREASERVLHLELPRDGDPSGLGPLAGLPGTSGVSYGHAGSPRVHLLSGDARVEDRFVRDGGEWRLARGARAFFQGNRFLLDAMVDEVRGQVLAGPVADLYAGVGLFAVGIAATGGGPVVAVEGDSLSAAELKRNASAWRDRLEARHEPVEAWLARLRGPRPRTIVVDPPRTGLSRRAAEGLKAAAPPRIIYVSCDVATLARDIRVLIDSGYALVKLGAFDLFPNTAHVETVAVLDR